MKASKTVLVSKENKPVLTTFELDGDGRVYTAEKDLLNAWHHACARACGAPG